MALREPLDTSFMKRAACYGMDDTMFPGDDITGRNRAAAYREAVKICDQCPVRAECLEWALILPEPIEGGVVAGLTPHELQVARKDRQNERRANYAPKCGTEAGYSWHLERGENCYACMDYHNRKGQRYGEVA